MPNVHIDALTIENFGPFYGDHTFDFRSKGNKSAILIGGKNGAGKTHLLRALYLAAIGPTGKADLNRVEAGSEATRFLFDRSLNRRSQAEGNDTARLRVDLALRDAEGAGERKVTFIREIRHRPNAAPVFTSYAEKDDGIVIDSEQLIQKLRDAFLPRHLASFFFFDAERGQNLDLGQREIVEGISRILGLQSYTDLENDLRTLYQQKIPKVYNSSTSETERRLMDITADIQKSEGYLRSYAQEQIDLTNDLQDAEGQLLEVEDQLRSMGAVDPTDIERAQQRRLEISSALKALEASLENAWDVAMPVALLGQFRKQFYDALEAEERLRDWDSARASVEPKIPKVQNDVFANPPVEVSLDETRLSFYSKRLEEALLGLFHPPPEGMAASVYLVDRNDLSAQIRGKLSESISAIDELASVCSDLDRLDNEARQLDSQLRQFVQDRGAMERGNQLREERGKLIQQRETIDKRLKELDSESATLTDKITELKREETVLSDIVRKGKEGRTLGVMAQQYREAVAEIRSRASILLRGKVSQLVGEMWLDIADRRHEFSGVEFDSNWQCWLNKRDGKKTPWDEINPSAGQRQVRLLAFTEALRRLARLTPPLVVDTPLGRLDKEVRESVLQTIYLSGHQSIVLATNAEIDPDGALFDQIKKRLARVYTLKPFGEPGSVDYRVTVQTNFFGRTV